MTNAEKLAKEMLDNLELFSEILFDGICNAYDCNHCPLRKSRVCVGEENIKKWLESEVEEQ